jgi:hypothetical protein
VPPWFPIMSDLRTAIAAAIVGFIDQRMAEDFTYGDLADAVIAALDLRIEDRYRSASGEQQYVGVSGFFAVKEEADDE